MVTPGVTMNPKESRSSSVGTNPTDKPTQFHYPSNFMKLNMKDTPEASSTLRPATTTQVELTTKISTQNTERTPSPQMTEQGVYILLDLCFHFFNIGLSQKYVIH